ncbi:response regulator [Solibacillus sp. CAU 1738]|uniref:response regulator n=1 Tax=Solibacillus sp. CAU 1738 TaxID=3140363 RepID=UPI003260D864
MLRTVVVDDEVNSLNLIIYFLKNTKEFDVIGAYTVPEDALTEIPQLNPDIIFLDVEMPRLSGIELAKLLKSDANQIVFITAYQQYALEALKLEASEYLLKPVLPENIEEITPKILKRAKLIQNQTKSSNEMLHSNIQCFGNFIVKNDLGEIIKWPTRKVEELFAYLLTNTTQVANKWRLAEEIWPEKGLHNMYNAVYLLNKTFEKYNLPFTVSSVNEGYKLKSNQPIILDIIKFEKINFSNIADPSTLEIVNYISKQGTLFENQDYSWAIYTREQYVIKHQKLLHQLLDYYQDKDAILYEGLKKDYERIYVLQ